MFMNVTTFRKDVSPINFLENPLVATCVIVSFIGVTVMCVIFYLYISKWCYRNGFNVNGFGGVNGGMLNRLMVWGMDNEFYGGI